MHCLLQGELLRLKPLVAVIGADRLLRSLLRVSTDRRAAPSAPTYGNEILVRLISSNLVELLVKPIFSVSGDNQKTTVGRSGQLTARAGRSWPSDPSA